jgi:general stress protein 26
MDQSTTRADAIARLNELMQEIKFAMLTTVEPDGTLRSRPMATQQVEFDGDLWFFTQADAPKVDEIEREHQVNVSYALPDKQRYISVSGVAQLVRDRAKMAELWNETLKIWFPNGIDDPNVALLKVRVYQAEYWESSSTGVGRMIDFVKALATKDDRQLGKNEKLDLSREAGAG